MTDDLINFNLPVERSSIIKVIGIGSGGCNAVNHMFAKGIKDVNFIICNSDHQALAKSQVPLKVQIGQSLTEGRGAGGKPEVGRQAALENIDDVMDALSSNTKIVFLTAGMGGGTGTGAIPVIAKACKEVGLLTIAVVSIPFKSEGKIRIKNAVNGITELTDHVDSLIVIDNEKLREIYGNQSVSTAFAKADDVLTNAVKSIAEIITAGGYINVDFTDMETVMKDSGVAIMGIGQAAGERRALKAIENALASPLLNSNDITGAKSILLNIASGKGENELTMDELGEITDYMYEKASEDALFLRGFSQDEILAGNVNITVIATGFPSNSIFTPYKIRKLKRVESLPVTNPVPAHIISEESEDVFIKHDIRSKLIISDIDETIQGEFEFNFEEIKDIPEIKEENPYAEKEKLERIKDMLKKDGLSSNIMKENIDTFEDVPAYRRRIIPLGSKKKESDKVHFSASFPSLVMPKQRFIIDVWAYLYRDRKEVINMIQQTKSPDDVGIIRPGTPLFNVKRGSTLIISLSIQDLIESDDKLILWDGEIVNTSFVIEIPPETTIGTKFGSVTIRCLEGLEIAKIELRISVVFGTNVIKKVFQDSLPIQSAFASYASSDRNEVLGRIQGMQKIRPDLNVFFDVLKLRSGQDWENELWQVIPKNDIFYLFWSGAAKESIWVEKEWRCALKSKGIRFIDPVPLVSPEEILPPEELSSIHFNDWTLAFKRVRLNTYLSDNVD